MNTTFAPNGFCGSNCSPFCVPGFDCSVGYNPQSWNSFGANWNIPQSSWGGCPVPHGFNQSYGWNTPFNWNWNNSYGFNSNVPFNFNHGFLGGYNHVNSIPFHGQSWNLPFGSNTFGYTPWNWSTPFNWNNSISNTGWNMPFGSNTNIPFGSNWNMPFGWNSMNWGMPFGMMPYWFNGQQTQNVKGSKKGETETVANGVYPYPFGFAGFAPFGFFNNPFCNSCEPTTRNAA